MKSIKALGSHFLLCLDMVSTPVEPGAQEVLIALVRRPKSLIDS